MATGNYSFKSVIYSFKDLGGIADLNPDDPGREKSLLEKIWEWICKLWNEGVWGKVLVIVLLLPVIFVICYLLYLVYKIIQVRSLFLLSMLYYTKFIKTVLQTKRRVIMNKNMTYEEYVEKVQKGIFTDEGNCPVISLLLMLQGKWKFQIIYELCIKNPMRFGELKKAIEGITNTMLTNSLRELEADGLVSRIQFNEIPPHVEYSLTEKGTALLPIFYEMTMWGLQYIP